MKYYAIIVAGGSGSRMQSEIPKQFMLLNGKPLMMHTIEAFYHSDVKPEIIVVINDTYHGYWNELCLKYTFSIPHKLVNSGIERFYSVKNGIESIPDEGIISIHDAVRPLVSNELICKTYREAEETGCSVAAVKSKDSIRRQQGDTTISINRDEIFLVQTPQVFNSTILRRAYQQDYKPEFTDDASVVERSGISIRLTEGDIKNIKITFQEDIQMAEYFMNSAHK